MQAIGIVDDHLLGCPMRGACGVRRTATETGVMGIEGGH
jgi:hypothetical protein